ncbi:DUF2240 family protein [Candidatus Woesearchaeota archaeon]|nr:MAG: DUF2240 family protein [Candidatus Woesearchaeota archaeon]
MISIPYEQIAQKIKEKTGMTDEELESRIKQKMDQLSGLISKEGAAHIIANEVGIQVVEKTSGRLQIKNVLPGMRSVEVVGRVVAVYEVREFESNGRSGKVGSFVVGDDTGTIRVVAWGNKADLLNKIQQGDIVKIKNAYVRQNQDRKELHLNDKSEVEINPEGEKVGEVAREAARPRTAERKELKDLTENDSNVEVLGTVVQVFDPRFFAKCPMCNRRVRENNGIFECDEHGAIESPNYSYVVNVFLDDGTDSIRIVFFGEQALKLLGISNDQMLMYRTSTQDFESVKTDMLGQVIKVQGRVSKNKMFDRLEMIANDVDPNPDPEEEIKRIKSREESQQ